MMFRIFLGIDLLTALVCGGFFIAGVVDGSVSANNSQIWIGAGTVIAVIIAGGVALKNAGKPVLSSLVLAALAIPALLFGLYIAMFVFTDTKFI